MALERPEEKMTAAAEQSQHDSCLRLFTDASNTGAKKFVSYIKDNFQTFDLDNRGSISIPELESVMRNPATSAINREAASIMISHFDQMANYIKGDDQGSSAVQQKLTNARLVPEKDYVDMVSIATDSPSQDITITVNDINAMALTFDPDKRHALEKDMEGKKTSLSIGSYTVAAPIAGTAAGVLGLLPAGLMGAATQSTMEAIGVAEATALTAAGAVTTVAVLALGVGVAGFFAYDCYKIRYKDLPNPAAIEKAFKQRQAMLDSWTCL